MGLSFAGATVALLAWGRAEAGGWAFPLDDAYIHLALARTLAESGTWGVNPGEFASATSSPAWTALLGALFWMAGVQEWIPLVLNLVALVAAFVVADTWLRAEGAPSLYRAVALSGVGVLAASPVVASLGMEHVLHLLVALALARRVVDGRVGPGTWLLAALLPMVRYEGLFLVAVGALLWAWRSTWRSAFALVVAASAPVVAFGLYGVSRGAHFLPNALVMKGALGNGYAANALSNLREGGAAMALVVTAAVLAFAAPRRRAHGFLLVGTGALQLGLASVGWYYRYEAWILAWGLVYVAIAAPDVSGGRRYVLLLALLPGALLLTRTFDAVRYFPGRIAYIHDTKVVLAQALARTAPGTVIALHDIGAMALYGDGVVVDTAGLATNAVANLGSSRRFTPEAIGALTAERGAEVGFATRSWMEQEPPRGWVPVAQLDWGLDAERRIEPLVAYAVRPEGAATARVWLAEAAAGMRGRGVYSPLDGTGRTYTEPAEGASASEP